MDIKIKERFSKRIFDIICLILLMPLFIVTSISLFLLYKIQGLFRPDYQVPLFYREERISNGAYFKIYKFTTVNSMVWNILVKPGHVPIKQFTKEKTNLTPIGYIISRFYIDELPQLINILKSEMSFVGPRPLSPSNYKLGLEKGLISLKYIKAGLFGLSQSTKGHPELYKILYRISTGQSCDIKPIKAIDRLYLMKHKKASSLEMLFFDLWIIGRCLLMITEAKGL